MNSNDDELPPPGADDLGELPVMDLPSVSDDLEGIGSDLEPIVSDAAPAAPNLGEWTEIEMGPRDELEATQSAFKERAKAENRRYTDAVDSEYWIAMTFQTREQKEEFLRKLKILQLGDKYLDGREVAKALGITLESREPTWNESKVSKRLRGLT